LQIIPAIDLRHGKVVRLSQGDYAKETVFAEDPLEVAHGFAAQGASRIHVVDLDGALDGMPTQGALWRAIAGAVSVPVQVGGGLRNEDQITSAIASGVDRVILGTAAVENPELVASAVARHGADRISVGLDARDGMVAVSGWTTGTDVEAAELLRRLAVAGIRRFVYTDIARDGMLSSPNYDAVAAIVAEATAAGEEVRIVASGGIANIEQLRTLATLGAEAAIVGSAIYRGTLDLAQAIAEIEKAS